MGEPDVRGRPTWAEIDLAALRSNLAWVRARSGPRRVVAVVKADAYGHGAVTAARVLAAQRCDAFAVATAAEAAELRAAGVTEPILLLQGLHDPAESDAVVEQRLWPMVGSLDELDALSAAAARAGRTVAVHLKLDTGMGRLGLLPDALDAALERIARLPGLALEGVASHLAEADDAGSAALTAQRARFAEILAHLHSRGVEPGWIHLDNSAGIAHGPTDGTTAVRPGLALYGADPTLEGGVALEPVMTLLTRVARAVDVPAGSRIGYGGAYETRRRTRILTLPIGYADGIPRGAGGKLCVGLGGRRVPLVGRVSMDLAGVDAGPDADARAGDEVLVFGRRGGLTIRVEEHAAALGTIPYELLVGIGPRVPRLAREARCSGSSGSGGGRSRP